MIDLHLHSYFSDGDLSPEKVIQACVKTGIIDTAALTDHETAVGVPRFIETGKRFGIKGIPGTTEFSTTYKDKEEHILGYFMDCQDPKLDNFFYKYRRFKLEEIKEMVEKLRGFDLKIEFLDVLALARGTVCRSHIICAVLKNPKNSAILSGLGIKTRDDFFKKFLEQGAPAYVERTRPSTKETIDLIKELGGIAIWAHPWWKTGIIDEIKEKAVIFQKWGFDGLEVFYAKYTREQTFVLHQLAQELSLYETIGSDFHPFLHKETLMLVPTYGLKLNLPPKFFE